MKAKKKTTAKKVTAKKASAKKTTAASKLAVGMPAPDFSLANDAGEVVSLEQFFGKKNVLLYFYPKDDTPGCTLQACNFQSDLKKFVDYDTVVLGVSADNAASHVKFRQKYHLSFPLLIDADHAVADDYGAWGEKNMYGKISMGIKRDSFLIDKEGNIAAMWRKVKVEGHSEEVLAMLRQMK